VWRRLLRNRRRGAKVLAKVGQIRIAVEEKRAPKNHLRSCRPGCMETPQGERTDRVAEAYRCAVGRGRPAKANEREEKRWCQKRPDAFCEDATSGVLMKHHWGEENGQEQRCSRDARQVLPRQALDGVVRKNLRSPGLSRSRQEGENENKKRKRSNHATLPSQSRIKKAPRERARPRRKERKSQKRKILSRSEQMACAPKIIKKDDKKKRKRGLMERISGRQKDCTKKFKIDAHEHS